MKHRLLVLPMVAVLAGCASLDNPVVRGKWHETQYQGSRALLADPAAFDRLEELARCWDRASDQEGARRLAFWDRANRGQAAVIASTTHRLVDSRDAILAQKDLLAVMGNALRDLESEFDAVSGLLTEQEEQSVPVLMLLAEQKYLVRRMQHSLVLMSAVDMSDAVAAADLFGRDVIRFQQLLDAAINGSAELEILPTDNPEVEESLAQIEELFTGYVADSSTDLLENVVFRHDAWLALQELGQVRSGGETSRETSPAGTDDQKSRRGDLPEMPEADDVDVSEADAPEDDGFEDMEAGVSEDFSAGNVTESDEDPFDESEENP